MKEKLINRREFTSRQQVGFTVGMGLIFALFSFIGSVLANILWWWQINHDGFLYQTIFITISIFVIIIIVVWKAMVKLLFK